MTDVHDKKTRSFNMSQVRSKDTKPEMIVRRALFANGFRFRVHDGKLTGKPDIALKKYKTVIFIHGCFWHGHEACKCFVVPKTRTDWWINKINVNKKRDAENFDELKKLGWNIILIWECKLQSNNRKESLSTLIKEISKNKMINKKIISI